MNVKEIGAGNVRANWAEIQSGAIAGNAVIVKRHDVTTAVMLPPEWEGVIANEIWQQAMPLLRQKYPGRSDFSLVTEVIQKWLWQQNNNGSKDAKLDKIYALLLWVAAKLGYKETA